MEQLHQYIKSQIPESGNPDFDCPKIISIENIDNVNYNVYYILIDKRFTSPRFYMLDKTFNLVAQMRDIKIQSILNSVSEYTGFDVESIIYTESEREKLNALRSDKKKKLNSWDEIHQAQIEYSESFQVGDKVWYNGCAGFVTFKHSNKESNDYTRVSVKIGDTEHRYICGHSLLPRKVRDISNIEIDPELNKLSTEKLLKIYKKRRENNKGRGDVKIKRILQEREHIQKGPNKIRINRSWL